MSEPAPKRARRLPRPPLDLLHDDIWVHMLREGLVRVADFICLVFAWPQMQRRRHVWSHATDGSTSDIVRRVYAGARPKQTHWLYTHVRGVRTVDQWLGLVEGPLRCKHAPTDWHFISRLLDKFDINDTYVLGKKDGARVALALIARGNIEHLKYFLMAEHGEVLCIRVGHIATQSFLDVEEVIGALCKSPSLFREAALGLIRLRGGASYFYGQTLARIANAGATVV